MNNMCIYRVMGIAFVGLALLVSGCARKHETGESTHITEISLRCIAVLPVSVEREHDIDQRIDDKNNLTEGVSVLTRLLEKELSDSDTVRFVHNDRFSGFAHDGTSDFLSMIREVGSYTGCNGVLILTLQHYRERVGGPYTAETPASVSFSWRLIEADSGTVLCHGRYYETQKSVMENLFHFVRASRRSFAWVTAERLLEDGLKEQFATCSHL